MSPAVTSAEAIGWLVRESSTLPAKERTGVDVAAGVEGAAGAAAIAVGVGAPGVEFPKLSGPTSQPLRIREKMAAANRASAIATRGRKARRDELFNDSSRF